MPERSDSPGYGSGPSAPDLAGSEHLLALGPNYRKLWTASAISNLGDGIDATALPLVAAALTRDPILFSGVAVAGRLPWLLFALHAGAIADRVDRRRLMVGVNVIRFVLLGVIAGLVAIDAANIWILYVVSFGLGICEVLFDNTAQALLPSLVDRDDLETANGRLFGVEIVANQFVGPPVGGFLFAAAAALPLSIDAATFLLAAGLIAWLRGRFRVDRDVAAEDRRLRTAIREGLSWLWQHRLLRTLGLLLGLMNGLSMAGFAILALYALEVLRLSEVGFGILVTTSAVGSVLGSLLAGRLVERLGRGPVLIATIAGNGSTMLVIGLTSDAVVTGTMMALFGFLAVVWNVITVSLRQTIIPDHLLGRVNSVYRFLGWGSIPVGGALGGVLADAFGLHSPFLLAGVILIAATLVAYPVVNTAAIDEARRGAPGQAPDEEPAG